MDQLFDKKFEEFLVEELKKADIDLKTLSDMSKPHKKDELTRRNILLTYYINRERAFSLFIEYLVDNFCNFLIKFSGVKFSSDQRSMIKGLKTPDDIFNRLVEISDGEASDFLKSLRHMLPKLFCIEAEYGHIKKTFESLTEQIVQDFENVEKPPSTNVTLSVKKGPLKKGSVKIDIVKANWNVLLAASRKEIHKYTWESTIGECTENGYWKHSKYLRMLLVTSILKDANLLNKLECFQKHVIQFILKSAGVHTLVAEKVECDEVTFQPTEVLTYDSICETIKSLTIWGQPVENLVRVTMM